MFFMKFKVKFYLYDILVQSMFYGFENYVEKFIKFLFSVRFLLNNDRKIIYKKISIMLFMF